MKRPHAQAPIDYELAKKLARSQDPDVRRRLAARGDIQPELLYFLAADQEVGVRREIANNALTPRHADLLLSLDKDSDVRTGLARKIARLAPHLPQERLDQIERMTIDILEALARDQTTEVRRILADELQSVTRAPAHVINKLARDLELSVCGPILRNSPILSDEDLLHIIIGGAPDGALSAIAERANVGTALADAIANSNDDAAVTVLLGNASAQIREETLDRIIDRAPQHEPWHGPLVRRSQLPPRASARLASFVADSLVHVLQTRTDLGFEAARLIAESIRVRLNKQAPASPIRSGPPAPADNSLFNPPWAVVSAVPAPVPIPVPVSAPATIPAHAHAPVPSGKPAERSCDRAKRLKAEGKLNEAEIASAISDGDRAFVVEALAELIGTPAANIERVLATHSARAVTSMVWRAGLSMRTARVIQLRMAQIPPKDALIARNNSEYPISESDMIWQLDFFDISA
ncbi:MAG: DUF2336 domain-containing protein [Rhodospirillaceae bacterium]